MTKLKLLIPALLLFFLAGSVWGQKKPQEFTLEELFDVSVEELLNVGIISASQEKQSVADAPATAYVVQKQDIESRGYRNLVDLLEDVPEIEIQRNSSPEFKNQVTIRGISGNEKFLILLNGIRITPPTGDAYSLGTNFSLTNVERVEVIIGPASALYGVDAFSGIINIITPGFENKVQRGAELTTSGGFYATTDNSFVVGTKIDRLRLSLSGNYYFSQEADLYNKYPISYAWYNDQFFNNGGVIESAFHNDRYNYREFERWADSSFNGNTLSRLYQIPTASYFINAQGSLKDFEFGVIRTSETHSASHGVDPRYTAYDQNARISFAQNTLYLRHKYRSFNQKWGMQTSIQMVNFGLDPESHFASSLSRWQRGYIYTEGQSAKFQEQVDYAFSRKVKFIGGASFENLTSIPRTGLSTIPYDPTEPSVTQDLVYVGAAGFAGNLSDSEDPEFNDSLVIQQTIYQLNYQNYGAYGQFQLKPLKGLEATLGARFDYNNRYGSAFNPRIGLVYATRDKKWRFKMLYGESFLAPSPRKAFLQSGGFYGFGFNSTVINADFFRIANPNLEPENLQSFEASASGVLSKKWAVQANGFYTVVDNLIDEFGEADASLAPDNLEATRWETSVNQGTAEIYGGTVKIDYLSKVGLTQIKAYGAYSYIDGNIDGGPLFFQAKHTVKAGVDLDRGKWHCSPRILFRTESTGTAQDLPFETYFTNETFFVVNMHVRYDIRNQGRLKMGAFASVRNLTDNRYYHVFVGGEEGFEATPQDPIRVDLGFHFTFL